MTKKKEDAETPKVDETVVSDSLAEMFAEIEQYKDYVVVGNICVRLCLGNPNDPTYREVTMDRMAREIKARFQ